ncbi:MAG: Holliday junction branch migration protein RuvA [Candidatus Adiutrix sp.]|jgi:Holliday junction DNA helicase RuvA|nr:Holliday junction branch migration protein RuvA [Candidatus Adiutrix sp.]
MITHLKGRLVSKKPGQAVVEAGGLGYELAVPLGTFLGLPEPPAEVALFTKLLIREESWDLYGFLTSLERESFLALTAVNRVGPKLALTIISALEPGELARALMTRDLSAIAGIKGIGAKTAERLMVELKDKAPRLAALAGLNQEELKMGASPPEAALGASPPGEEDEAVSALLNLGYTPAEARQAARLARSESGPEGDLGQVLRLALKTLTRVK